MDLLKGLPVSVQKRLKIIGEEADKLGLRSALVGGTVRDILWSQIHGARYASSNDIDITVESVESAGAVSSLVADLNRRLAIKKIVPYKDFMTYTLSFKDGASIDIATSRREIYERPAALPKVSPAPLEEDLFRRDFTVNAMAVFISGGNRGQLFSPHSGSDDLKKKVLRVFHGLSFKDDPTRLFRGARYCGRFGFSPEPVTKGLILKAVSQRAPAKLTPARLRHELDLLLGEYDARLAFDTLDSWQALQFFGRGFFWDKNTKKRFGPGKGDNVSVYRLLWLLYKLAPEEAALILKKLSYPGQVVNKVCIALGVLHRAESGQAPDITALNSLEEAQVEFLGEAMPRKLWRRCISSRPHLRGKDLLALGLESGPLIGKALGSLVQARWEGRIKTRSDETEFIANSYRK